MKKTITIFTLGLSTMLFSQNIDVKRERKDSYTASNGITYRVGDTVPLGRGSDTNGRFNYLQAGGLLNALAMGTGSDAYAMSGERNMAGQNAVIKKIKKETSKRGSERTFFVVGIGSLTNANLFIEDAIATCEVKDCIDKNNNQTAGTDKYDNLKKLKELLDSGVLTQEEFKIEKDKIMAEN